MAVYPKCAYCGSIELMSGLDNYQCLQCGKLTRISDGVAVPPEPVFEAGGGGELQLAHLAGGGPNGAEEVVDPHQESEPGDVHGESEVPGELGATASEEGPSEPERQPEDQEAS